MHFGSAASCSKHAARQTARPNISSLRYGFRHIPYITTPVTVQIITENENKSNTLFLFRPMFPEDSALFRVKFSGQTE